MGIKTDRMIFRILRDVGIGGLAGASAICFVSPSSIDRLGSIFFVFACLSCLFLGEFGISRTEVYLKKIAKKTGGL